MLLTLVLGIACLSCTSAAPVSGSLDNQFLWLQQEFQQTVAQMQIEINELKSTNAFPKSGKQNFSVTYDIFYQPFSKDTIHRWIYINLRHLLAPIFAIDS